MPNETTNREITNHRGLSPREWAQTGVMLVLSAIFGAVLYIANKRYYIRPEQLIEGVLYLVCLLGAIWLTVHYCLTYQGNREKSWPRVPPYIPPQKDRRNVEKAFQQNAIVLGYPDKSPKLWPDDARRMQGILLGASGSGKTTVLTNIIVQDINRRLPNGRRMPVIIFDGKGDGKFLKNLMFEIAAAGRRSVCSILKVRSFRATGPPIRSSSRIIPRSLNTGRCIPGSRREAVRGEK